MKWLMLRTFRRATVQLGLGIVTALSLGLATPANAAKGTGIAATFDPRTGVLAVKGDDKHNKIVVSRDAAGAILVNAGAVSITGGRPSVADTNMIEVWGLGKNDTLSLDEANGPLPTAHLLGGEGDDTLAGGTSDGMIDGGDGHDTVAVMGSGDDEMFAVTAENGRVRFERTNPHPFTIDISAAEILALTSNGGLDRVAVGADVDQLLALAVDGAPVGEDGAQVADDGSRTGEAGTSLVAASSITSSFSFGVLTVFGDALDNTIVVSRDAAGNLLVNGGAVKVSGGKPTIANTTLIRVFGQGGHDTISLDETNGALPKSNLFGSTGNDSLAGGSGADQLFGQSGNDALFGKGGDDFLFGGADHDTLTAGAGNDQVYGESGNDTFVWNPGDGTDLDEGGDGADTIEVNGSNIAESFTVTANGTRVRFDQLSPTTFALDIGTSESLVLNAKGGDDSFSATGNLAALIQIAVYGDMGNDTLLGSNGADVLNGGDGNDFVDGQQGSDLAQLGAGDDTMQWDPGDGSDTVEGQDGSDRMRFNGSAANEIFEVTANGARVRFSRNVATIVMDLSGIESLDLNAFGGTDALTINDLSGTGLVELNANLTGTFGGTAGDALPDTIIVNGTNGDDIIDVVGAGTSAGVVGLSTVVNVANSEGANDALVVNALGGADGVTATTLPAGVIKLTADGGAGDDTLLGSQGADVFLGGDNNDFIFGDNGNDLALMGADDDTFQWDPGDGNDTLEGQGGSDLMLFFGSDAGENIDISANGGRVLFFRNVASVTMDLDDVERIEFRALGGMDTIVVGDLSGTDLTRIDADLRGPNGGGDAQVDTITVNATQAADTFGAMGDSGGINVFGLPATVNIFHQEQANDRLTLNALGGDDAVDATSLEADGIQLTLNGGLGVDTITGSQGDDSFNGGDGDDRAIMGPGDDTFTWNPGDDNDTLQGQDGADTLLFNGANVAETIDIGATGDHAYLFRSVASVIMDFDGVERLNFIARGGADMITVSDLTTTDLTEVNLDLSSSTGSGDAQPDSVILNGSDVDDLVLISGDVSGTNAQGLAATLNITGAEAGSDRLTVNTTGGDDTIDATGLAVTAMLLTESGGGENDVLIGGEGDDVLQGGDGDDVLVGGPGVDLLDGGTGNNILIQD